MQLSSFMECVLSLCVRNFSIFPQSDFRRRHSGPHNQKQVITRATTGVQPTRPLPKARLTLASSAQLWGCHYLHLQQRELYYRSYANQLQYARSRVHSYNRGEYSNSTCLFTLPRLLKTSQTLINTSSNHPLILISTQCALLLNYAQIVHIHAHAASRERV